MTGRWFYAHDDNRIGPYSDQQLRDLADVGKILPTDTVWREGTSQGVPAAKVKNLFVPKADASSPAVVGVPPTTVALSPQAPVVTSSPAILPLVDPLVIVEKPDRNTTDSDSAPAPRPVPQQHQAKKGRAVAGKGAILVGQDGTFVKLIKKCTVCGHQDSSRTTLPIRCGLNKVVFFCPKCRKKRDVEFQGYSH